MTNTVKAKIMNDEPRDVSKSVTLRELAEGYASQFANPIVLCSVNNEIRELHKTLTEDCDVRFYDITDPNGFRAYQRSLVMLMVYAVKSVLGKETRVIVSYSMNRNFFIEVDGYPNIKEHLSDVEAKMRETVTAKVPIEKVNMPIEEAAAHASECSMIDNVEFFKYRRASNINMYKIDWFYNYFCESLIPTTEYLETFALVPKENGFYLQFPSQEGNGKLNELKIVKGIIDVYSESRNWSRILKVSTVGELNGIIASGGFGGFIRACEALHEKKIGQIADMIREGNKKIVLIAGPSSSGKTTFAERLSIQLRVNGQKPHVISLDNYFKGRDEAPIDEFGQPDFESFDYMNKDLLNSDLDSLLAGKRTEMPTYDFHAGRTTYKGNSLILKDNDVLILEGIHALNEELTYSIPRQKKFKVFISALTQLAIDDNNRIPTTDTRLLRRIIRDFNFRGMPATRTINMWPSVLRGEIKHIFPFQEEADSVFNSALVYELCVLKQFAEPLLFGIDKQTKYYAEARRLIKFLDSFIGMSSEEIPNNSILREFIGGSVFHT